MNMSHFLDRLLLIPALILVIGPVQTAAAAVIGDFYVSGLGDDMTGDGSEPNPWRTITHAVLTAGGGAPTIMVGAGSYSGSTGEFFPISITQHDAAGISIQGPGDGSAVVELSSFVPLVGIGGLQGIFGAPSYITGDVMVDGLDVVGSSGGMLLDMSSGAANVTINDIHADGIGLLSVYAPHGGDYMVSNNEVVGASSSGVYVAFEPTDSSTVTGSLSVIDNSFVECGSAVYYSADVEGATTSSVMYEESLDVNVSVVGNAFEGCSNAIYMYSSATGSSTNGAGPNLNANMVIDDNTMTNCGYGMYFSFDQSYTGVFNRNIEITNNSIVGSSSAIYFSTSFDEYPDYNETVLIEGNSIQGVNRGIYQSFEKSYTGGNMDREWSILNNTIKDCSNDGIYLYQEYDSSERGECNYSLTIDGNAILGNGDEGIDLSHYASYTAASAINHTITRNNISNNADGIDLAVSGFTADIAHNVVIRGNILEGNAPGGVQISMSAHMDTEGSYDLDFDMGNPSAFGYNTIVADGDNPSSSSLYLHVHPSSSMVTADLNLVGNWWGTQDAGLIEDRVYHGPDSSGFFTANLSSPLADQLNYSATVEGALVRLTAAELTGFVPYAGELVISVTVDGVAANNVAVASDYGSLTFDNEYSGEVEICVTNPGGQSGCLTATPDPLDCNENGVDDADDISSGGSLDLNNNSIPDECEPDCDGDLIPDFLAILYGLSQDCNGNEVPDECDISSKASTDCDGDGVPDDCQDLPDCDGNGVPDGCDLDCNGDGVTDACDPGVDCNGTGIPDECELVDNDCNVNGVPDECDISSGYSADCNSNGVPDECDLDCNDDDVPDECDPGVDCNGTGIPDECELVDNDCNANGVPDECDFDCDGNGWVDDCDPGVDCNDNGIPDECDIDSGNSIDANGDGQPDECKPDCNENGLPDYIDISLGVSADCDQNGIPDECEEDCNENGVLDVCDLVNGTSYDCDQNAVPDECDPDCDEDGTPDACEGSPDCDANGVPDECDPDCDDDGTPDACDGGLDCNSNDVPDECDIAGGEPDCDADGVPDTCQIADDPNLDQNNNELLDVCECFTSNYCTGEVNTTGLPGRISFSGSAFVGFNDLSLVASDVPTDQFGIFYYGPNQVNGGLGDPFGEGRRCVGGQTVRLPIVNTGSSGSAEQSIDNTQSPHAENIQPGSSWNFQFWYRDPNGGPVGYNLTDALSITFCP